jgi:hypothetical protein
MNQTTRKMAHENNDIIINTIEIFARAIKPWNKTFSVTEIEDKS